MCLPHHPGLLSCMRLWRLLQSVWVALVPPARLRAQASFLILGHVGCRVQALAMGLVNAVVPLARLEEETLVWCREMLRNSPTALRVLKSALNAAEDGQAGLQACRMSLAWCVQ